MAKLHARLLAHPIRKKPYNAIRFSRFDGNGTPLYRVSKGPQEMGAAAALKTVFAQYGGHCFHCTAFMDSPTLGQLYSTEHIRPKKDGGSDYLHNLVFACRPCNSGKGGQDLAKFSAQRAAEYLKALDEHLVRCIKELLEEETN